jgi:hypothetical protein
MHLLHFANPNNVNIVESEKTAVICAIAYGRMNDSLWLATGGKTNLTREKLKPIMDAHCYIQLYPDKDGLDEWREISKTLDYDRLTINTGFMDACWREEDGQKADIADVIVRMITQQDTRRQVAALIELEDQRRGLQILDDIIAEHPSISILVNKLHLEIVTDNKTE